MTITEFTPLASLTGGAIIGLVAVLMMAVFGRIAGISGIAVRMLPPYLEGNPWARVAFIAGLAAAAFCSAAFTGVLPHISVAASPATLAIGGLLVGFGSVWGSGCTSGHGVCGLSRLSRRSMGSVLTFMAVAALVVFVTRHLM